jgi:hypothetical protein
VNLLAPQCGAGCADRKHKIVAEPHVKCGPRSALFTLRLSFYFSQTATFILFHALLYTHYYFIMHHLFTAFIATFIICVHGSLPRRFFFLFNSFKSKSKPFFTVQYIFNSEPYHTAPTVAML